MSAFPFPSLPRNWSLEILALGTTLSLYGTVTLYQLSLPGLYYDEAADAVPAMQLLLSQPLEQLRGSGLQLLGRTLPLMVMDYVGAVHTYAVVPFFAWMGVGTVPLRLMSVLGGALTVALLYWWTRWLFHSRWLAFAAALLLAAHPSYVFYVRQGVHVSSLMALWAMSALLFVLACHRTGSLWWLVGAFFFLGLGLSTKILFLWFILALLIIYFIRWGAWLLHQGRLAVAGSGLQPVISLGPGAAPAHPSLREAWERWEAATSPPRPPSFSWTLNRALQGVCCLVALALGAGMVILYNFQTEGTLTVLGQNVAVSQYGVRNADYLPNLLARLDTLRALLEGGHFWFLGGLYSSPFYPAALGLAVASLFLVFSRCSGARRAAPGAFFVLGLVLLVLLQSPLTISGIWPTHLFFLLPFLMLLIALGLYLLGRYTIPLGGLWIASVVVVGLVGSSLWVDLQYHEALRRTGGLSGHSDAVYDLAAYLDQRGEAEPIAMDWGIKYSLQLLTEGRVNPLEVFQYAQEPTEDFVHWLYGLFTTSDRLYLFHAPEHTVFSRYKVFSQLAQGLQKEVRLERVFYQRDGTPLYLVYSIG